MTIMQQIAKAAADVRLAFRVDPVARELYGVADPVLDETATLRRVALFVRGTGRATLSPDERDVALAVLRGRC